MSWKYEGEEECRCGVKETIEHVLCECGRYDLEEIGRGFYIMKGKVE